MQYLKSAIELAQSRGYLDYPQVHQRFRSLPKWYLQLGTQSGLDALVARLGRSIPESLIEYYSQPLLVSFLEFAVDGFILFDQEMHRPELPADRLPVHLLWDDEDYLAILDHPHSGTYLAASLDVPDPQLVYGTPLGPDLPEDLIALEEVPHATKIDATFSQWIYATVDGYDRQLDFWEAAIRRVDHDPKERARVGNYDFYRKLPGMSERLEGS